MPIHSPLTSPQLRAETAALRRLARVLVHDSALADDIVQDTWLAAMRRPPARDRPLLPWLARVLRNNLVSRRRAVARSEVREREVAGLSAVEDPAIERFEIARVLVAEIERLAPADRELVRLVFWEGLSSAECAERLDRPASTVRTQLQRTLTRLRRRLDARGGRQAWVAAIVPFVGPAPGNASMPLFASGLLGSMLIGIIVVTPHGCGAPLQTTVDDVDATSSPAAITRAINPRGGLRVPARSTAKTAVTAPTAADRSSTRPAGDVGQLKLAFFEGLRAQADAFAECRDHGGAASTRLASTVAYGDDHAPIVESAELGRIVGLTDEEIECVRQTALAVEIADVGLPPAGEGTWAHVYDLRFGDGDRVEIQGFRRGPATDLNWQVKGDNGLDDAVAECNTKGASKVRITFDPTTGATTQIQSDHRTAAACIEAALERTLVGSNPFEPERPEDATLVCTFDEHGHKCERLGPGGGYL
jgi:RNA polymerase sigma factor (sigma-70 family)